MWPSPPTTVNAEAKGVQLQIDPDVRLSAAVGGVARFLGETEGLTAEEALKLQKSVVAACQDAFEHLTGAHPHLTVTFTRHHGRIEIALIHDGEGAPAVGLDRIAGFAGQLGGSGGLHGVDRIQYETRDGLAITRLTKYLGPGPGAA
jgi:hypothetical protein